MEVAICLVVSQKIKYFCFRQPTGKSCSSSDDYEMFSHIPYTHTAREIEKGGKASSEDLFSVT